MKYQILAKGLYSFNRARQWRFIVCRRWFWIGIFLVSLAGAGMVEEVLEASPATEIVGEAFGKPVTMQEFNYYYRTALMFTRTGKQDRSEEEAIQEAWQNLIFRKGAGDLNITVSGQEFREELKRLLAEKDIEHGSDEYRVWVDLQFKESIDVFERRIEDLLVINKFMDIKTNPEVTVTEEEMKQKFLNQYNSFESEYIKFDSEQEAEQFFQKVKQNPRDRKSVV